MKEYTIIAVLSVFITFFMDNFLKTNLFKKKEIYLFLGIIAIFKFIVNGFLTSHFIVQYNPNYFLGIRIWTIPLEDFLFGFSMASLTIIFWEFFKRKENL